MRPADRLMSLRVTFPGKGRTSKKDGGRAPSDEDDDGDEPDEDDMGGPSDHDEDDADDSGLEYGYDQPMAHERRGPHAEPDEDDMGGPSDHDEDDGDGHDDDHEEGGDGDVTADQLAVGRDLVRAYREGDARGIVEGILALVGR